MSTAIDAGYGLTESQKSEGVHHRFLGTLGLGLVPLQGLEFAVLGGIRHDRHPDDGMGTDSGTIGDVGLMARWGTRVGRGLRLGADFGATFPGTEKPGESLTSPALDLRALFGWAPPDGVRFAGFAGFRFDQTSGVGGSAGRYRAGDRLALGVSDFNAVLVGAGVSVPLGSLELLGEASGDLLVGAGAPAVSKSPLRLDVGLRQKLSRSLQAELLSEFALSSRPGTGATDPLIPVEPRIGILLGLRYHLWQQPESPPVATVPAPVASTEQPAKPPPTVLTPPPPATPPATGKVVVTVLDSAGHPLSDAVVELTTDAGARTLDFQSGATFVTEGVPVGQGRLTVRADLMREWSGEVLVPAEQPLTVRVEMVAAENTGQIRGVVRAFDGTTLAAQVRIEPGGRQVQAGPDGSFKLDVPPGKYSVKVMIDGYQPQVRNVEVGKNGVMVLNVDLQKGR